MNKKEEVKWYVGTIHAPTNKVISTMIPVENTVVYLKCSDHFEKPVWKVNHFVITSLIKSKDDQQLCFSIYKKIGDNLATKVEWQKYLKKYT